MIDATKCKPGCGCLPADSCPKCGPGEVSAAIDRSGWPVLVRDGNNTFVWPDPDGRVAVYPSSDRPGMWRVRRDGSSTEFFATKEQAAEYIRARLPDAPPVLATHAADDATRAAVARENARINALYVETKADLLSLRQRLREAIGMAERATDDELIAEAIKLMEHANHDGQDDRLLDHALALLDLAAEKNTALQHIAALIRIATSR